MYIQFMGSIYFIIWEYAYIILVLQHLHTQQSQLCLLRLQYLFTYPIVLSSLPVPNLPKCFKPLVSSQCKPSPCSPNKPACPDLPKRKCPLPGLSWADPNDVWNSMCECDRKSCAKKNPNMFDNHPNLQPRMRAILLDWLNEVRR